jgi:hypothetical protein
MKNTPNNKNQNDDGIVETMSFAEFFLDLPIKYMLAFFAFLWVFAMAVVIGYIELTK